jgi:multiple sugar transport system ATP-binding protein
MSKITLQNVTKYYGKQLILDNISLEIKDKELLCITGPSGCGKTTLLRLISGLDTDYKGRILIDDIDCINLIPAERNIAMVFQEYALYPNLRAKDNIVFPLKIKRYSKEKIYEKLHDTVEHIDVEVEKYLNFFPKALSAGHKQRVATGRAIIRDNPNIFLLDEPLSNLDAKIRMNTRTYLKILITELKSTTVYVTADTSEAMAIADRIAVIENGRFVQVDTPYNLYNYPKNIFIANFFGLLGMNFIEGNIRKNEFCFDNFHLSLSSITKENFWARIKEKGNKKEGKVILGIRPEDIIFSKDARENSIKVNTELIQKIPPKAIIRCKYKDLVINVIYFLKNFPEIKKGMSLYLSFPIDKIYFFNYKSSESLLF